MTTETRIGKFQYNLTPGKLLFIARRQLHVSQTELAARMNIDINIYRRYERNKLRIPNTVLLKIFMFGIDFWADKMTWEIPKYNPHQK